MASHDETRGECALLSGVTQAGAPVGGPVKQKPIHARHEDRVGIAAHLVGSGKEEVLLAGSVAVAVRVSATRAGTQA